MLGYMDVDLTVWPIRTATRSHVFYTYTSYHLLLERLGLWAPRHASTCHQWFWRGKEVHVNASEARFPKNEAHFSEVAFFDGSQKMEK